MDKIDRFLDAMEHPDNYASTEIDTMLQDPEIMEMLDLLDKTKSSLHPIIIPDMNEEWDIFKKKHSQPKSHNHNWFTGLFTRNTAASITVVIASFTAVATIIGVSINHINHNRIISTHTSEVISEDDTILVSPNTDSLETVTVEKKMAPEIVIFDDETLETVLENIAVFYDCHVEFNNQASKSLRLYFRWNKTLALEDVVKRLNNFEQIKLIINDNNIRVD